jgi:hypothetical protein
MRRCTTQLSLFWFELLRDVIQITSYRDGFTGRAGALPLSLKDAPCFAGGQILCPSNAVCADTCQARDGKTIASPEKSAGRLPPGLRESERRRKPFHSVDQGHHGHGETFLDGAVSLVGAELAEKLRHQLEIIAAPPPTRNLAELFWRTPNLNLASSEMN